MFFVGYTVTNVCGGYLAARYTSKLVLAVGVVTYSTFTILMPVAAASKSVYVVLACACLMGAGEGVIFPAIQHWQGKWLPPHRRTLANTLLFSGEHCICVPCTMHVHSLPDFGDGRSSSCFSTDLPLPV